MCVSLYALKAQRRAHDQDAALQANVAKEETADRLSTALHDLAQAVVLTMGPPDPAPSQAMVAAFAETQQLALRVDELRAKLIQEHGDPGWFCSLTLAVARAQLWDTVAADAHWTDAVAAAEGTEVSSMVWRSKAAFHFNAGRPASDGKPSDFDEGRACFTNALKILKPGVAGWDLTLEQDAATLSQWATLELVMAANILGMQEQAGRAWNKTEVLHATWRKLRAQRSIAYQLAEAFYAQSDQSALRGLPGPLAQAIYSVVAEMAERRRQAAASFGQGPPPLESRTSGHGSSPAS